MVTAERRSQAPRHRPRRSAARDARRRLSLTIVAFASVVVVGFLGYQVLEGVGPLDSLYMTIITITTVGSARSSSWVWRARCSPWG